jgi:D-sedoheptulose 7-phosphate isomerase
MDHDRIRAIFRESAALHAAAADACTPAIGEAAALITRSLERGGKLLAFGNGGSAADAQHFVAEFVGRFQRERRAFGAIALTADTSILTSIANDYSYELVFVRQIAAVGRRGDVAFGITTSGRSPNVLAGLRQAKSQGLSTIALSGARCEEVTPLVDLAIAVPSDNTARIQEVHRTILHSVCELVEAAYE